MTERVFIDTNIWVYAVDRSEPDKRERARSTIAPRQDAHVSISSQVLSEFYTVVTRKLAKPVPEEQAAQMVDRLAQLPVVSIDADLVLRAIAGSRTSGHLRLGCPRRPRRRGRGLCRRPQRGPGRWCDLRLRESLEPTRVGECDCLDKATSLRRTVDEA